MSIISKKLLTLSFLAILAIGCSWTHSQSRKINGVSFVAPPQPISQDALDPVVDISANWIAITPYAFSRGNTPSVTYNHTNQWWGESRAGTIVQIQYAKAKGLKIMLKPHVWVIGQGWAGDYLLANEQEWREWSNDYKKYMIDFAMIADSMQVEMFCIGTEYRKSVSLHPELWTDLIEKIRKVYNGKLTYAANWDNYENVTFWNDLDYIGIDAYFPLSEEQTPNRDQLMQDWKPIKQKIRAFSEKWDKPILFSEYGYRSIDYTTAGHWKHDQDTLSVNMVAQANAYKALYQSFWKEDWFAGGFLWKWHSDHERVDGWSDKEFTPQNKPVEQVISNWFKTH